MSSQTYSSHEYSTKVYQKVDRVWRQQWTKERQMGDNIATTLQYIDSQMNRQEYQQDGLCVNQATGLQRRIDVYIHREGGTYMIIVRENPEIISTFIAEPLTGPNNGEKNYNKHYLDIS